MPENTLDDQFYGKASLISLSHSMSVDFLLFFSNYVILMTSVNDAYMYEMLWKKRDSLGKVALDMCMEI